MSNEEIVEMIQNKIDVAANQELLWRQSEDFVSWIIKRYIGDCCQDDFYDYKQQGYIGIIEAIPGYNRELGYKFLTYAESYIKKSIFRYNGCNASSVRVPEYLKQRMRKLEKYKTEYYKEHHKEPAYEEICQALHISRKSCVYLEKAFMAMHTKSLDEYVSADGSTELIDMLSTDESIEDLVGSSVFQKELHHALKEAFGVLDADTERIIYCVYYQGNSIARAGEIFGCSRQNIDDRIKRGFYKILHSKHRHTLEMFLGEDYHVDPEWLSDYVDQQVFDCVDSDLLL